MRSLDRNLHDNQTTIEWVLEVKFNDVTLIRIPLKNLKDSNPVELAEYTVSNNVDYETTFKWQLMGVICKQDQVIVKVKETYYRIVHKFVIQVPKMVDEAYKIYHQT